MRGLVRPCRHQLPGDLRDRWRAHLCGLCLTLRDEAGQRARLLTGYDVLLLSVLVEAQAGHLPTAEAGPCPLRAMQPATVVRSDTPAMQVAAGGALLTGAAGLADKVHDGDVPRPAAAVARRAATRLREHGRRVAHLAGVDADAVLGAPDAAATVESTPGATLQELLAPAGAAVAELFAATAAAADRPANGAALRSAGDAFGRLVHLADAAEDRADDARRGRFNPLDATGTTAAAAAAEARRLHAVVTTSLEQVEMADRSLADALFGPVLARAVRRLEPAEPGQAAAPHAVGLVAVAAAAALGVFGGPSRRRRRPYYDDPRYDPRYDARYDPRYDPRYARGYGGYRRGPGCCDLLACDCCASMVCSEMCGGDCCVCCL